MIINDDPRLFRFWSLLFILLSLSFSHALILDAANGASWNPPHPVKKLRLTHSMEASLQNIHGVSAADQVNHTDNVILPSINSNRNGWEASIRRAAGGKDTHHLQTLITTLGWTAAELDAMSYSDDGKSALHMAAWKGSMSNIQHLLQFGCQVNNIARGKYSYGKTPIFFAVTQGRDDVVHVLLDHGAHVKIVNNKGQSVLSLASSHLSADTIQRIQQVEVEQHDMDWINYRLTHSDGAIYGDLDPRFYDDAAIHATSTTANNTNCDHEQSTEHWIKTDLAINPTTPQSRRGAFARRNPQLVYQEIIRHQEQKRQTRKAKPAAACDPTTPAMQQLRQEQEEIWQRLSTTTTITNETQKVSSTAQLLLALVRLYMTERRAWIPEVTNRWNQLHIPNDTLDLVLSQLDPTVDEGDARCTGREWMLLQKIVRPENHNPHFPERPNDSTSSSKEPSSYSKAGTVEAKWHGGSFHKLPKETQRHLWQKACQSVQGLTPALVQNPDKSPQHLSLPYAATWVDTPHALQLLRERLQQLDNNDDDNKSSPCIAFDTEWSHSHDDDQDQTMVATLQLAIYDYHDKNNNSEGGLLPTWIIDLQLPELRSEAVAFLQWLLYGSSHVPLLGFAIGRDLRKLEEYIMQHGSAVSRRASVDKIVLDLQILCAETMSSPTRQPGLQTCCHRFVSSTYSLSKTEQCSDWARRPLTSSQLEYAGLDAGVLLVLLAQLSGFLPSA